MVETNLRLRLLTAALIDRGSLAAAIAAAQAAEAWLQENTVPVRLTQEPTAGGWIEETIEALRHVTARGGQTRSGVVALHLGIEPCAASWRLRQLVAAGRITAQGEKSLRRYRLVDLPTYPQGGETLAAAVQAEAEARRSPAEAGPSRQALATQPVGRHGPAKPQPEPPLLPQRPQPMPPRIDRVAPSLAVEFTTIDGVVRFLRSRDFSITGGPAEFLVDNQPRDAAWLLERANKLREHRGLEPFSLGGPNG